MKKNIINILILISFLILISCIYFIYDENKKWDTSDLKSIEKPSYIYNLTDFTFKKEYPLMDFNLIHEDNSEIIAWLVIPETKINYPVVQGNDNSYYVDHSIKKEESKAGCLFLDYRVCKDFSDFNNVIYGHNMKNGDMFGQINMFKERDFFINNLYGWLYTPEKTYKLDIFSCAITDVTSDFYKYKFTSLSDKDNFVAMLKNTSIHWRNIDLLPDDSIIIFSTCSDEYDDARVVVCAAVHHNIENL